MIFFPHHCAQSTLTLRCLSFSQAESLNKASVADDPWINHLLRQLATQAMSEAQYSLPPAAAYRPGAT
jgi:hypothetical protein